MQKKSKGKLIVIDGTDGSGKATQVELLAKTLKNEGYKIKLVDFPEYYKNFFGKFIGHCLSEQYYNFINVHPKIASVLYAADRFESSKEINSYLEKGYIVLANRYVSANQIHQGGKIKSAKKRAEFIKWLDEMEYGVFKIPKPNLVLYLSVPLELSLKMMKERNKNSKRNYVGNKKDVHEVDTDFQKNSRASALWLSKTIPNFIKVDCSSKKDILSREIIHQKVLLEVNACLRGRKF
ncbi:MAG: deoxynucleoside kinase [Candidatus Pacebacteria bacterium]|nr:deoxynucleoside kinase [Candidatus Paceibacterota bacterium]